MAVAGTGTALTGHKITRSPQCSAFTGAPAQCGAGGHCERQQERHAGRQKELQKLMPLGLLQVANHLLC